MAKYFVYHDPNRCIGCLACEVSCTDWKGLPYGQANCRIFRLGPEVYAREPGLGFVYFACFHCEEPLCVEACPTGALVKRQKDGTVILRDELCVGCGACLKACPWGIPQWNPETGKMTKCDHCVDRIDQGLDPACVTRCPMDALKFVPVEEVGLIKRQQWLNKLFDRKATPLMAR